MSHRPGEDGSKSSTEEDLLRSPHPYRFLYNPIKLYVVNKAVEFVPYVSTVLSLDGTAVTEQHWSVRKQGAAVQE